MSNTDTTTQCTGTTYEVNPGHPDEGHDIYHDGPCPTHPLTVNPCSDCGAELFVTAGGEVVTRDRKSHGGDQCRAIKVLAWRIEQADPKAHADLAAELLARAAELAEPPLPEDQRPYSYEGALQTVTTGTYTLLRPELQERLARRVHTHGHGTWHTHWVLFGNDGRGCHCGPCSTARGER